MDENKVEKMLITFCFNNAVLFNKEGKTKFIKKFIVEFSEFCCENKYTDIGKKFKHNLYVTSKF